MTHAPVGPDPDLWGNAQLALHLLSIDPAGLGGIWLRARSGPVRDRWMAALDTLPAPHAKLHPTISDDQLFGGLDLSATLATGAQVRSTGLIDRAPTLILTMAERTEPGLVARLSQVMDRHEHSLIALDEGTGDEALAPAMAARLAFHLDLEGIPFGATTSAKPADTHTGSAAIPAQAIDLITRMAAQFGIDDPRAILFTLNAARAHAVLHGRREADEADLHIAAQLVLAPRATQLPATEDDAQDTSEPPPSEDTPSENAAQGDDMRLPDELLLEAIKAAIPPDLLARLAARKAARSAKGAGSGAKRTGNRRGRPLPPRAGRMDGRARLDLVATLRAAAPWQPMRRHLNPTDQRVQVRPSDLRLKRYQEQSDRLLVFTVDASGSAALARLAEAKGAVELLLAEAYARRDHVALVAFRGDGADVLLPPTRSLVQTKRRLAALPGGGGTPLASGIEVASQLALQAKSKGLTPSIVLLTDGRANIARDGSAGRAQAAQDANSAAMAAFAAGLDALVIDMGTRPERALRTLAEVMGAPYVPLPRADAAKLSKAVTGALG